MIDTVEQDSRNEIRPGSVQVSVRGGLEENVFAFSEDVEGP